MSKTDKKERKKIVAAAWHPGGVDAISPVIKRLNEERKTDVVVIGHQFSEKIFRSNDISYKTIIPYGLKDVSLGSMILLLQVESPDLVLTGTSVQDDENRDVIEQTITLAARRLGIKSLAVLDFWANYSLRFKDIVTGEIFKFLPDKIAIMDKAAQQAMLKEGFDKTRLVITGGPHFDELPNKAKKLKEAKKQAIRQAAGLDCNFLIFYAANAFEKRRNNLGYWDLDNIRIIDEVLTNLPGDQKKQIGLVVKLHPRTPQADLFKINQYIEEHSEAKIRLVTDIESQELILASDITLVADSTIGVKAVYMGKPCLSLQPGLKRKDLLIVSEKGFIPAGYTIPDCMRELEDVILSDSYRKKELPRRAASFKTDGRATERVKKLVYQMLEII